MANTDHVAQKLKVTHGFAGPARLIANVMFVAREVARIVIRTDCSFVVRAHLLTKDRAPRRKLAVERLIAIGSVRPAHNRHEWHADRGYAATVNLVRPHVRHRPRHLAANHSGGDWVDSRDRRPANRDTEEHVGVKRRTASPPGLLTLIELRAGRVPQY